MSDKLNKLSLRATALRLASVKTLGETGDAMTVQVTGILKLHRDRSELVLLERFQQLLGDQYTDAFPAFRDMGIVDGMYVFELEHLTGKTLEDWLLQGGDQFNTSVKGTSILSQVIGMLNILASKEPQTEQQVIQSGEGFVAELVSALTKNAKSAGLDLPESTIENKTGQIAFVPTVCHRDLSVANIMVLDRGGARFIDPRRSIPTTPESSGAFGSVAIDCAALLVSLERKDLEMRRKGFAGASDLVDSLRGYCDSCIERELFNTSMLELCLAHAYSVYAACRCDYCLAPEREWLYRHMQDRLMETMYRIG